MTGAQIPADANIFSSLGHFTILAHFCGLLAGWPFPSLNTLFDADVPIIISLWHERLYNMVRFSYYLVGYALIFLIASGRPQHIPTSALGIFLACVRGLGSPGRSSGKPAFWSLV